MNAKETLKKIITFFFFKRKPVITTVTILQLAFRARKQHIVGPQKKKKQNNKLIHSRKKNGCHYFVLYFFFFWNSSSVVWCAQHKLTNCLFVFFCLSFGFTAINVFCYFSAIQQRTLRKEQFAEKKKNAPHYNGHLNRRLGCVNSARLTTIIEPPIWLNSDTQFATEHEEKKNNSPTERK